MLIRAQRVPATGVSFQRQYQPLMGLAEHGAEVGLFNDDEISDALGGEYDIYFAVSPAGELQRDVCEIVKKHGHKVVFDFDDSEHIHPLNPAYVLRGEKECRVVAVDGRLMLWKDKETRVVYNGIQYFFDIERNKKSNEIIKDLKRNASALTTTTETLRRELLQYNPNVFVLPNAIDPGLYIPETLPDEVRLGWTVGNSHIDDVVSFTPTLIKALREHPGLKLMVLANNIYGEFETLQEACPGQVEVVPGVAIDHGYHRVLAAMKVTMGICHVEGSQFDICKSPLKWCEWSAFGVPSLCSRALYSDYVEDRKTGMIHGNEKEFLHNLRYLMTRPELREKIGAAAREEVVNKFGLEAVLPKYAAAFDKIVESI